MRDTASLNNYAQRENRFLFYNFRLLFLFSFCWGLVTVLIIYKVGVGNRVYVISVNAMSSCIKQYCENNISKFLRRRLVAEFETRCSVFKH